MVKESGGLIRRELMRLRIGKGLTPGRVASSPALLEVLDTTNPTAAYQSLVAALNSLGPTVQARALRCAYGIGLAEPGNLTSRRGSFARAEILHPDTVENYENSMLDELTAVLSSSRKSSAITTEDFLLVVGVIEAKEMVNVAVSTLDATDPHESDVRDWHTVDRRTGKASMPVLVYRLPMDASPAALGLSVMFRTPPFPTSATSVWAPDHWNLMLSRMRKDLRIEKRAEDERWFKAEFRDPQPGCIYAVFWEY